MTTTLSSLFIVCSHGRRSAHKLYEKTYTHITGWCQGGRPVVPADLLRASQALDIHLPEDLQPYSFRFVETVIDSLIEQRESV